MTSLQTFGQLSATKRKRNQTISIHERERKIPHNFVRIVTTYPLPQDEVGSGTCGKLFSTGDFYIDADSSSIVFYRGVAESLASGALAKYVVSKPHAGDFTEELTVGSGPNDSLDVLSSSKDGRLVLANITKDEGDVTFVIHKVPRQGEDEMITSVCHAGNAIVLGTSYENLYLIRRYGRALTADRLQRSQSFLAELFNTGAKLMGILPSGSTVSAAAGGVGIGVGGYGAGGASMTNPGNAPFPYGVLKTMPVPMSFLLLALSHQRLSLWTEWSTPGSERLVWEVDVKAVVLKDLTAFMNGMPMSSSIQGGRCHEDAAASTSSVSAVTGVVILDACLMQPDPGAERAVLLILSVCQTAAGASPLGVVESSSASSRVTRQYQQLWLHTWEVQLPSSGNFNTKLQGCPISLLHRLRIAGDISYSYSIHSSSSAMGGATGARAAVETGCVVPALHNSPPSWRVFVTWSAPGAARSSSMVSPAGDTARVVEEADSHVHALQLDVLSQPELNAAADGSAVAAAAAAAGMASDLIGGNEMALSPVQKQKLCQLQAVSCAHGIDSAIGAAAVVSAAAVAGIDGVTLVLIDGTVMSVCPPLPQRTPQELPAQPATVQSRMQEGIRRSAQATDVVALLLATAWRQCQELDVKDTLHNAFAAMGALSVVNAVSEASSKICAHSSSSSTAAHLAMGATNAPQALRSLQAQRQRKEQLLPRRYQSAFQLAADKLDAHRCMVQVLQSSGGFVVEEVRRVVDTDHQLLLLCAGLASAVEEAQLRLSSQGSGDDARGKSDLAGCEEALRVVARGMEVSARRVGGARVDEMVGKGVSMAEIFFAQTESICDGVGNIVRCLCDDAATIEHLRRQGMLLDTTYHLASLLLSALQCALGNGIAGSGSCDRAGASSAATCVNCRQEIRTALLAVMRLLLRAAEEQESSGGASMRSLATQHQQKQQKQLSLHDQSVVQGKRLKELCVVVLNSYALEAAQSRTTTCGAFPVPEDAHADHMPEDWKRVFQEAKRVCSSLLLKMHQPHAAFSLCSEFLYCTGMLEAFDAEPSDLRPRLLEVLRQHGHRCATDSEPLATACFSWLEQHQRPAEVLDIGAQTNRPLLEEFLSTRPHLAWMYHIQTGQYSAATATATKYGCGLQQLPAACTILSIAKLSAKVSLNHKAAAAAAATAARSHSGSTAGSAASGTGDGQGARRCPEKLHGGISSPSFSPRLGENSHPNRASVSGRQPSASASVSASACGDRGDDATDVDSRVIVEMNATLAALHAQQVLTDIFPRGFPDPNLRVRLSDLVDLTTRALSAHGASSLSVYPTTNPAVIGPAGTTDEALSPDIMDDGTVDLAVAPENPEDLPHAFVVALSILSIQLDVHDQMLHSWREKARGLWSALVIADVALWLELAALYPAAGTGTASTASTADSRRGSGRGGADAAGTDLAVAPWPMVLGTKEEAFIREESLLYAALVKIFPDVAEGKIRPSLVPYQFPSADSAADIGTVGMTGGAGSYEAGAGTGAGAGAGADDADSAARFLEAVVVHSGVAKRYVDAEGGLARTLTADMREQHLRKVMHVVKMCVGLAARHADVQPQ